MLFVLQAMRSGYEFNPSFSLTEKMIDERAQGIDDDLLPLYAAAGSVEQLDAMYAQNLARMDRRRILQNAGLTGVVAGILSELTDPLSFAASALTGGSSLAVNATRGARALNAARAGLTGAVAIGSVEAYRASQNPQVGTADVATSTASGALMGAALGAAGPVGIVARMGIGATASASPVAIASAFRDDQDAKDVAINAGAAFLLGAFGGAMSASTREAITPAITRLSKDVEFSEINHASLTPKGKNYYAEQYHAADLNARAAAALHAIAPHATEEQAVINAVAAKTVATEPVHLAATATRTSRDMATAELSSWILERAQSYDGTALAPKGNRDAALKKVSADLRNGNAPESILDNARELLGPTLDRETGETLRPGDPDWPRTGTLLDFFDKLDTDFEDAPASVGAATQAEITRASPYGNNYDIELRPEDFKTAAVATDSKRTGMHLNDMGSMVSNSQIPTARKIGNMIFGDHLPKEDGSTLYTADWFVSDRRRSLMGRFTRVIDQSYREMRKAGLSVDDATLNRQVFVAVIKGIPADTPEPIARAARAASTHFAELLEVMRRHGVRGALDVPNDPNYMPHHWLRHELDRNVAKHGEQYVIDLLATAIAPEYPDLTPKHHEAFARYIVKNAGTPRKPEFIAANAFDNIADNMREAGYSAEFIADTEARLQRRTPQGRDRERLSVLQQTSDTGSREAIRDSLETLSPDSGNASNLKFRIQLDETVQATMPDGTTLSVLDLLETDPRAIMHTYSTRAYGNSALAQVFKHSENPAGPVAPVVSLGDLLHRLREEAKIAGRSAEEEGNILRIEAGLKNILGVPTEDLSSPTRQRVARALNTSKVLMAAKMLSGISTGIQNFTEVLSAIPALGTKAVFQAIPALWEMRKAALDGTLTHHDLALAEYLTGAGADFAAHATNGRPHGPSVTNTDRFLSYIEPKAAKLGNIASHVSGMQLGNEVGEKFIGAAQISRWGNWATSGKRPPKWALKTTTLKPEMVDRILAQIRKHATNDANPETGIRQKNLNWFEWDDTEAASAFRDSIAIESRRLFVRGNKNELQKWMGTAVGSTIVQFRTFRFQAFRAKLAYGLSAKDTLHGATMLLNMGFAAAAYMLTSYAKSLLLPASERQDYLDRFLSPKAIGLASISQASWSSMLPPAVDATATTLGFDPVFSFTRTSGITGRLPAGIDSFPLGAQASDLFTAGASLSRALTNSDPTVSEPVLKHVQKALVPRVLEQTRFLDMIGNAAKD